MAIEHLTTEEAFDERVGGAKGKVLVDFFATWCGPCRMVAPILEEIAAEDENCRIIKIDVDEAEALAVRYGIESIPTLVVFENGQPVAARVGYCDKEQILAMLK